MGHTAPLSPPKTRSAPRIVIKPYRRKPPPADFDASPPPIALPDPAHPPDQETHPCFLCDTPLGSDKVIVAYAPACMLGLGVHSGCLWCTACRTRHQPGDGWLMESDGRITHIACAVCPRCDLPFCAETLEVANRSLVHASCLTTTRK